MSARHNEIDTREKDISTGINRFAHIKEDKRKEDIRTRIICDAHTRYTQDAGY